MTPLERWGYEWQGRRYVRVTHVLQTLAKPALIQWAGNMAADAAIALAEEWETLDENSARPFKFLGMSKFSDALREYRKDVAGAHRKKSDEAKARGTDVHAIVQNGVVLPNESIATELQPYAEGLRSFWRQHMVQPLDGWAERKVVSSAWGYAGTVDLIARIDGLPRIIDFKTVVSADKCVLYPEHRLQLAAYRECDWAPNEDGTKTLLPETFGGAIVFVYPDGYRLELLGVDNDVRGGFLALLKVWLVLNEDKAKEIDAIWPAANP